MNCVNKNEGHGETIQGLQNLRKDGQLDNWLALKVLYIWNQFNLVLWIVRWLALTNQSSKLKGEGKGIAIYLLLFWAIMCCSTSKITFCQREELDADCCNTSSIGPLWWKSLCWLQIFQAERYLGSECQSLLEMFILIRLLRTQVSKLTVL